MTLHYKEGEKVVAIVDGRHKNATILFATLVPGGKDTAEAYMLEIDATGARGQFDLEHIIPCYNL